MSRSARVVAASAVPLALVLGLLGATPGAGLAAVDRADRADRVAATSRVAFDPDPAARYGVERVVNHPVVMADGTRLVGNVYYPTRRATGERVGRNLPVLVTMTPYGAFDGSSDGKSDDVIPSWFAARGYVALVMDTRGSGRSGGTYAMESPQEMRDYLEVIDHAAHRLPGGNGVVGLSGMSYRGLNQLLVGGLLERGTPVKAMAPASAGSIFRGIFFNGGMPGPFAYAYAGLETVAEVFPPDQLAEADAAELAHLGDSLVDRVPTMAYHARWLSELRRGGPISHAGWWRDREPVNDAQAIVDAGVPVLLTSGHGDFFVRGSLHQYAALQNAAAGRPVHAPMDPRVPTDPRFQLVWGADYTDGAYDLFLDYELQWFDHWLKGVDNGVGAPGRTLHAQELGGAGRWVDVPGSAYPMTRDYTPLYLGPPGRLSRRPARRARSVGLAWRPGAELSFTTAPFDHAATVAGPVTAALYASTDATELEVVAALQDVAPDGTVTTVVPALEVDGALVASQRAIDPRRSWRDRFGRLIHPFHPLRLADAAPVRPGRVMRLDVEMIPRLWSIPRGHRLRLVLTSQDVNVVPTDAQALRLAGSTARIHLGGRHASYLNLPLVAGRYRRAGDPNVVGLAPVKESR